MRQVQYMTQLLQQVIFKKNQNRRQEAKDEIENALNRLCRTIPKEFSELSPEETLQIFMLNSNYKADLAMAAAELLIQKGEMLQRVSYSRAQKSFVQALTLLKKAMVEPEAAVPLDIQQKIRAVESHIADADSIRMVNQLVEE